MPKTIHWRAIPGVVVVVAMTEQKPSDEDWEACLTEIERNDGQIKGVLVYSSKEGPSASQRARHSEVFGRMKTPIPTAIMTGSRVVRGMVTALSWAVGGNIKAFSTMEFTQAVDYLGVEEKDQIAVRVVLKQLARAAGVEVEAFADESGKFRKKFQQ